MSHPSPLPELGAEVTTQLPAVPPTDLQPPVTEPARTSEPITAEPPRHALADRPPARQQSGPSAPGRPGAPPVVLGLIAELLSRSAWAGSCFVRMHATVVDGSVAVELTNTDMASTDPDQELHLLLRPETVQLTRAGTEAPAT